MRPHRYAVAVVGFKPGGAYMLAVYTNNARSEEEAKGAALSSYADENPGFAIGQWVFVEIPQPPLEAANEPA